MLIYKESEEWKTERRSASEVFEAHNAKEIHRFFRAVSMSVSSRSQSNTPNQLPTVDFSKLPDDELDLSDF